MAALSAGAADRNIPLPTLDLEVDHAPERGGSWTGNRPAPPPAPVDTPDPAAPEEAAAAKTKGAAAAAGSMTLADARENFPGVAERYIEENSRKGYWPLRDPEGVVVKLKLLSFDLANIRQEAPGHFSAVAELRDMAGGAARRVELSVDLSDDHWVVEGVRLIAREAKKPPKRSAPRSSHARPKP